jgi:three-Cys-motif partner protein
VNRLLSLRKEFHTLDIALYHGDCNKVLHEQILPQLTRATQKRAIVFVDPFGMHIEWQTMVALAQPRTIEVFVNVPIMAVQRSVLKRQPEKITPQDRDRMRRFWGSDDWEAAFYQEETTLFGSEQIKVRAAASELARRYGDRLATLLPYHTQPIVMTNSANSPLYALVFASHNRTGVKIAQDIFAKYLVRNERPICD